MIERLLGEGHIYVTESNNGDDVSFTYRGSFPDCDDGDALVILHKDDFESIIKHEMSALMTSRLEMPKAFYNVNTKAFPDEIIMYYGDNTQQKMFLERFVYSQNFKDMVWIRYVSVDESFYEENENE